MKYAINHKDNHKEYRKRQSNALRRKKPVAYLLSQAKYRAKQKGIPFEIELSDIEVPTHCPVFGLELLYTDGRRGPNSYSLDRWDNSLGYIKGNVRVISWKANQYKGDMTVDEVKNLLAYMTGQEL